MYNGSESGIVWALKEAREGSIYHEFIAFSLKLLEDENYKTLIVSALYDLGKMTFKSAFISLPKLLSKRLKAKREALKEESDKQDRITASPNVVDFRINPKLKEKWGKKQH